MAKIEGAKFASERLRLATEFHTLIYRRANRPFFLEQVSRARNNLGRYWLLAWNEKRFPASTQIEHEEILKLCMRKNRDGVMALLERHIIASGNVVLSYLRNMEETKNS